jgi:hypothetical protein
MHIGKSLLLGAVLATAPFTVSTVSAQGRHTDMSSPMMQRDRATTDRDMRDMGMRDRDRRDMRGRDDRDMRHYGWRRGHHYGWWRGHHYGWRHCVTRWHHHHRVHFCR